MASAIKERRAIRNFPVLWAVFELHATGQNSQRPIRNDQVVLRICPWPARHRARLAAGKAIVIGDIGGRATETVLADPPVYAGTPDMPKVRPGSDPNGVVRDAVVDVGGVQRLTH